MSDTQISALPGTTSNTVPVAAGMRYTITPGSGGTALLEHTTGSAVDIKNGTAAWTALAAGPVSSVYTGVYAQTGFVRLSAYTSAAHVSISDGVIQAAEIVRSWPLPVPNVPNTVVTGGNSVTHAGGYVVTSGSAARQDDNWFVRLLFKLGPRFEWLANVAMSGETTRQQINRLETQVFPLNPGYYVFMEGTNSIASYVAGGMTNEQALAATIADTEELINKVLSRGIRMIMGSTKPRGDLGGDNAARNSVHDLYARWVLYKGVTTPNLYVFDAYDATVDRITGLPRTNFLKASDNLHMTPKGADAIAAAAYPVFDKLFPANMLYIGSTAATVRANTDNTKRINVNPFFQGSGGTAVGAVSGTIAQNIRAGYSGTVSSAVASLVARSDGFGNDQQIVCSGMAAGAYAFVGTISADALPLFTHDGNNYILGIAHVSVSGQTNIKGIEAYITTTIGGVGNTCSGMLPKAESVAEAINTDYSGWIMTPIHKPLPGTITALSLGVRATSLSAGGAVTLRVGRMEFINLGPTYQTN